jgi:hypothetical protein
MKVTLTIGDETIKLKPPGNGASHAEIPGRPCPFCREPILMVGGREPNEHDGVCRARGFTFCCAKEIGELRAERETFFGHEEDERVLRGRCRVY